MSKKMGANKQQPESAVDKHEECDDFRRGSEEGLLKTSDYADSVNNFYDIATITFENKWGESWHFANRWHGETLRESIKRQEHFIALQLGLKKGMKVLDVGCGIGGPLREIARFSSASVTGLNIHGLQISRAQELNISAGLSEQCDYVEADFMNMPFPDGAFDAVYAIEATCDAPDVLACYKEICRVLKPGQHFALHEWCMTDQYDAGNERHRSIKAEIESADGLPEIRSTRHCIQALKAAGFEVIWEKDLAEGSPVPWYSHLDPSGASWASIRRSRVVRFITRAMVKMLELVRVVPEGSAKVSGSLGQSAQGLVNGGKEGIFTPIFFVLARKPESPEGDLNACD